MIGETIMLPLLKVLLHPVGVRKGAATINEGKYLCNIRPVVYREIENEDQVQNGCCYMALNVTSPA